MPRSLQEIFSNSQPHPNTVTVPLQKQERSLDQIFAKSRAKYLGANDTMAPLPSAPPSPDQTPPPADPMAPPTAPPDASGLLTPTAPPSPSATPPPQQDASGLLGGNKPPAPPEEKPTLMTAPITTIAKSAAGVAGAVGNAFLHPIDTLKNMGSIGAGAIKAGGNYIDPNGPQTDDEDTQKFNAMTGYFKNRYGSIEGLKKTLNEDPVGMATDIATFFEGGGGALAKLGDVSDVSAISRAGKTLKAVGETINPVSQGIRATGKVLGAVTGAKNLSPFSRTADATAIKTAQDTGIQLPVSAMTKNRFVQGAEAVTQHGLFGAPIKEGIATAREGITNLANNAKTKIVDLVNSVKNSANETAASITPGASFTAKDVGSFIKNKFEGYVSDFNTKKGALYDQITTAMEGKTANPTNSVQALKDIIEQKGLAGAAAPTSETNYFKGILDDLTKKPKVTDTGILGPGGATIKRTAAASLPTWEELKAMRTEVGKRLESNDPIYTGNKAQLGKLYGALSEDLDASAKAVSPEMEKSIDAVNGYYKETIGKINSPFGRTIANSDPEDLLKNFVKPNNETDLARLKEVAGPEAFQRVSSSFLTDIIKKSSKDGVLDFSMLKKNIGKYDVPTLKALLGEDQLAKIQSMTTRGGYQQMLQDILASKGGDIEKLKQSLADFQKEVSANPEEAKKLLSPEEYKKFNAAMKESEQSRILDTSLKRGTKMAEGSQTAFIGKTSATGALFLTHPIYVIASLLGERQFSKFLSSPEGRAFFTTGLDVGGKSGDYLKSISSQLGSKALSAFQAGRTSQVADGQQNQ